MQNQPPNLPTSNHGLQFRAGATLSTGLSRSLKSGFTQI